MPLHIARRFLSHISGLVPGSTHPTVQRLKLHSGILLGLVSRQFDYVATQKIRRTCSLLGLYNRLWDRDKLRIILQRAGREILQKHRRFLLGLSVVAPSIGSKSSYNWNDHRLPDEFMLDHKNDIKYIHFLREKTLTCPACKKRYAIENEEEDIEYCRCDQKKTVYGRQAEESIPWLPFLEKKDIVVWRMPHPEFSGLFIYMMYGNFSDVSPNEFLEVQLDLSEFRLKWDRQSAQCSVLEEEVDNVGNSLSQIYYWEVTWPRFFSNRDYVCNRRTQIFDKDRVAVIYSKATEHPAAPKKCKNHRVEKYWSVLCAKPNTTWSENGVEFSLIAFENPGLSLPTSITTWVAMRGMPEFMDNLRRACKELRKSKGAEKAITSAKERHEDAARLLPKILRSSSSNHDISQSSKRTNQFHDQKKFGHVNVGL